MKIIEANIEANNLATIQVSHDYSYLAFRQPMHGISNAPWLGGHVQNVQGILNLRVSADTTHHPTLSPDQWLATTFEQHFCSQKINLPCIGMMTAASMKSFRYHQLTCGEYSVLCAVTSGLNNARRVGDKSDTNENAPPPGTINLVLVTDAPLSPSAQLEAFALLCEAKTAACYDHQIISQKSPGIATGTGTDVTAVISQNPLQPTITYCGKHTELGESIGKAAYQVLYESIQACVRSA